MAVRCLWQLPFVATLSACGALTIDISPDLKNSERSNASYAGLTSAIAGTEQNLYAVSLNAGLWVAHTGGAWKQLANSPAQAQTIAIDPANELHVLVGERAGLARPEKLNQNGVWETSDGGATWQYVFNPGSGEQRNRQPT